MVYLTVRSYRLQFPTSDNDNHGQQTSQLRFIQSDHRGGYCDCWAVTNLSISNDTVDSPNQQVQLE